MADLVITIDGPAASGKSTMARLLAARLGAAFLDTGAMYRAVTLAAIRDGADLADEKQLLDVVARHRFDFESTGDRMLVRIDGHDVTEDLRSGELTAQVRHVASAPRVRSKLVAMQSAFAADHPRVVTEGRDQGTVAFPNADVKIYLTASAAERARRRVADLEAQGVDADPEQTRQAIESRDRSDENRAVGPLRRATDAIAFDSTGLSIEQAIDRLYQIVEERCPQNS
jgi:cytidylate kinase